MFTDTTIHPSSFLAHLCRQDPLTTVAGKELLRQIPFLRWDGQTGQNVSTTATIVSVDNGNDAFKGAMLHAHTPSLRTKRIITAYAPAGVLRAGEGITTWQVNDSEPFWMGEDALLTAKAESLPIGTTEERLPDERYRHFLFASLTELLREAGYETPGRDWQGDYDLYLSFGLPNEEITRSGVKDTVNRALQQIFNVSHVVRRALPHEKSYPLVRFSPLFLSFVFLSGGSSPLTSRGFRKRPLSCLSQHKGVRFLVRQVGLREVASSLPLSVGSGSLGRFCRGGDSS